MSRGPVGWVAAAWRFVVDVALRWYHGRVGDLAASVTFWIVISMPALVLSLLAVLGPLDDLVNLGFQETIEDRLIEFVERVFTDENLTVRDTINGLFDQTNNNLLIVSVGLAVWSISRGFSGLIRALEDIYDIEDRRPWYHTRVVAVILGLGSILISVPLVLLEIYVWGEIDDGLVESTLRGLVAILVLILWASIVYHYGPAERHRWRFDLPGAIVAAVMWWLLSFGFARYVDLAANANAVRSAFGAVLLALTWIWLAAQVFLIGGAVNYILGERLGVARGRRAWTVTEVVTKSTGEIRKIVVPEREDPGARTDELAIVDRFGTDIAAHVGSDPIPTTDPAVDPNPNPVPDQPKDAAVRVELTEPPRNGSAKTRPDNKPIPDSPPGPRSDSRSDLPPDARLGPRSDSRPDLQPDGEPQRQQASGS